MKILLTAFDPFGGESINPAQEAVRLVRGGDPHVDAAFRSQRQRVYDTIVDNEVRRCNIYISLRIVYNL